MGEIAKSVFLYLGMPFPLLVHFVRYCQLEPESPKLKANRWYSHTPWLTVSRGNR